MRTFWLSAWSILIGVVSMISLAITLIPFTLEATSSVEEKAKLHKILGLQWEWWAIIGIVIFVICVVITLVRLSLKLNYFYSDDYRRQKEEQELRIKDLEWKKLSRQ